MIEQTKLEDYPEIEKITNLVLGFHDPEEIEIKIHIKLDGKIIGFGSAGRAKSKMIESIRIHLFEKIGSLNNWNIGCLSRVAILPEYRGCGYASMLVEERLKRLEVLGYNQIIASAWKSPKGVHVEGILKRHGFRRLIEIDKYWKGMYCVSCEGSCNCQAVFFHRSLL